MWHFKDIVSGQRGKHMKGFVVSFSLTDSHPKNFIGAQTIEKMVQKRPILRVDIEQYWANICHYFQIFGYKGQF